MACVSNAEFIALFVLVGAAGGGSQGAMNAMVGQFYPDECRGTGVSWAVMMSRFGAVVGPILAGVLLGRGVSVQLLFLLMAIPVVLFSASALVLSLFHQRLRRDSKPCDIPLMTAEVSGAAKI